MSPKRAKLTRKLRGAQKWILEELRTVSPPRTLTTAKISKRIAKSSGKDFHKNSIYNALRILVQRGEIQAVRAGQEKAYQVAKPDARDEPSASPVAVARAPPATLVPIVPASILPHKLALGEVLVLGMGDGYVLAATNLHGRLVIERHPVPD